MHIKTSGESCMNQDIFTALKIVINGHCEYVKYVPSEKYMLIKQLGECYSYHLCVSALNS